MPRRWPARDTGCRGFAGCHAPSRHQLRPWVEVCLRLAPGLCGQKLPKPLRRQRRQQPVRVAKVVRRGKRYPFTTMDWFAPKRRLQVTLSEIQGLGHAWSGGAASQAYSDPKGPDASRMVWAFAQRQFGAYQYRSQQRRLAPLVPAHCTS